MFTLLLDLLISQPQTASLDAPTKGTQVSQTRTPLRRTLAYGFFALLWAVSATPALDHSHVATGTVCPVGKRLEPPTPVFQLLMRALDAAIVVRVSRLWHIAVEKSADVSRFMSTLLLTSAAGVMVICIPRLPTDANFFWATDLHFVDIRDLLIDSVITSTSLLCGLSLLLVLHPTTIALPVTSLSIFGFAVPGVVKRGHFPAPFE